MNRANILYIFGVLCIVVSSSFAAPPEHKDASQNEVDSNLHSPKKDVETIQPVNSNGSAPVAPNTPQFVGVSSGTVIKIGFNETCMY